MIDALARRGEKVQSTERIACKAAPSLPGYICDFKSVACSAYTKKCDKSSQRTGRFVQVSGSWMFMGDVNDPSRGTVAPPEPMPTAPPVVTDLGGDPAVTRWSRRPTPTPSPTTLPTPQADRRTPHAARPSPPPNRSPPGVNRSWLTGRWGAGEGDCSARRAVNFGEGGGFYGKRGMGNWSLKGKTVTVSGKYTEDDKPFTQKLGVERTGDDAMTMEGKRYHRCTN